MKTIAKYLTLFLIGAGIYFEIEFVWRILTGHLPVHWTMPILGGTMFIILGGLNNWIPWEMSLLKQGLIGMVVVTAAEFVSGCVLNLWLGLGIWDYSHIPGNILGQICLPFMAVWFALSLVAIVLDDWLRHWLFGEEKPHYVLW